MVLLQQGSFFIKSASLEEVPARITQYLKRWINGRRRWWRKDEKELPTFERLAILVTYYGMQIQRKSWHIKNIILFFNYQ